MEASGRQVQVYSGGNKSGSKLKREDARVRGKLKLKLHYTYHTRKQLNILLSVPNQPIRLPYMSSTFTRRRPHGRQNESAAPYTAS